MATNIKEQRPKHISREFIAQHAAVLFEHKGIPATSINDIVRRAGIAKGTFYLYFRNKEDLIDSVISHSTQRFLIEVIAPHREIIQIRELTGAILAFFEGNRMYLAELRANIASERLHPSTGQTLEAFSVIVRRFLNPVDEYAITDWGIYTRVVLGTILDVCHKAIITQELHRPGEAEEMLGDLLKRFFSCT